MRFWAPGPEKYRSRAARRRSSERPCSLQSGCRGCWPPLRLRPATVPHRLPGRAGDRARGMAARVSRRNWPACRQRSPDRHWRPASGTRDARSHLEPRREPAATALGPARRTCSGNFRTMSAPADWPDRLSRHRPRPMSRCRCPESTDRSSGSRPPVHPSASADACRPELPQLPLRSGLAVGT